MMIQLLNKIDQLAETMTNKESMGMFLIEDIAKTNSRRFGSDSHEFAKCVVNAVLSTDGPVFSEGDEEDENYDYANGHDPD